MSKGTTHNNQGKHQHNSKGKRERDYSEEEEDEKEVEIIEEKKERLSIHLHKQNQQQLSNLVTKINNNKQMVSVGIITSHLISITLIMSQIWNHGI